MTRRKLDVGPDGMANVMLLTNPIPRHVSLVPWGANDRPTTSWKSEVPPAQLLRSPPGDDVIDVAKVSMQSIQVFISETVDAWGATVSEVLATPLTPSERAARIQGLSIQAGSRIAAMAVALSPKVVSNATRTYKGSGLKLPQLPNATTLQGEIDRRRFMASFHEAAAAVTDAVLTVFSKADDRMTESILEAFSKAGTIMAEWALSMPAGVVGIQPKPEATQNRGARNSKADSERMKKIQALIQELIGNEEEPPTESKMSITLQDLQTIASADPKGFLAIIKNAVDAAKALDPKASMKVFWGETGVDPLDPQAIISSLRNMSDGSAIASLIASAVSGIDVGAKAETDSTQVAATMRSGLTKFMVSELEANPNGKLAQAVKTIVAPSVAEALKAVIEGGGTPAPIGSFDFSPEAEDEDPWTAALPGARA